MLASLVVVVVEVDLGSSILLIASSCKIVIVATSSTFFMDSSSVQAVRLLTSRAHHAQDLLMTSMQLSCWPSFDKGQNFTAGNDGSNGS